MTDPLLKPLPQLVRPNQASWTLSKELDGRIGLQIQGLPMKYLMTPAQAIDLAQKVLELAGVKLEKVDPRKLLQ
jgi:hypothetical protein